MMPFSNIGMSTLVLLSYMALTHWLTLLALYPLCWAPAIKTSSSQALKSL